MSSEPISLYDPSVLVASVTNDQILAAGSKTTATRRMLHPLRGEVLETANKELRLRVLGYALQWAQRSGVTLEIVDRHDLVVKIDGRTRHLVVVRVREDCSNE